KEHPVEPGLPDVLAAEFKVRPVSLPQDARYVGFSPEFRDEDLAAARKALSQAHAAAAKARASHSANGMSDDAKQMTIAVAEAREAAAAADLASLEARWNADLAKCAAGGDGRCDELAVLAASAERQAAACRARLAVIQGEQALASARAAEKPDDAKTKAALT